MNRLARRIGIVVAIGVLLLFGALIDTLFLRSGLRPATDLEVFRPPDQALANVLGSATVATRHPTEPIVRPDYAAETMRKWLWDGAQPLASDSAIIEIEVRQFVSAHLPTYFYSKDEHRRYDLPSPTVIVDTHVVVPGWDDQGSWADDCNPRGCESVV